ncbi:MAG: hypothetical protein JWN64_97 [Parcubacteria group bacterium]|nr:hypothetical protein [Parcubacteria group bacterium]
MLVVKRSPENPIIAPNSGRAFEAVGAFNPSVVVKDGTRHVFYRAHAEPDAIRTPGRAFSTVGYAATKTAVFDESQQVISPTEEWEHYGCEDPRATYFEGKWYVFYTALGGYPFGPDNIKVAVAVGDSPTTLTEKHLVTPFNAKAATLFPERINGEVVLLLTAHTDWTEANSHPTIGIARAKQVEDFWNPEFWKEWHENLAEHALPDVRRSDTEHMEIAATPVRIPQGWLLIYSHIQNYYDEHKRLFGVEALLLDANDPQKIIGCTSYPFMVPEESYERYGLVSNIVFPTSAVIEGDILSVYYGAADTSSALATLSLSDLLETMTPEGRAAFATRFEGNPILSPTQNAWETRSVCNAAAIDVEGSVHLLYRAMGAENTSVMGYARLADGLHVDERSDVPAYAPREDFEKKHGKPDGNSGCEDPRAIVFENRVHLCYTAYDGEHETRGAYSSISVEDFVAKRFDAWSTPLLVTPAGMNNKDIAIFPEPVAGKFLFMHRIDPDICLDELDTLPPNRETNRCIELMGPRPGMWDAIKVGAASQPIKVPEGWLFIYHGVGGDHEYRLGAALLDEAGTTVIARTVAPILEPVLPWEREGMVPNVVFSCGIVLRDDTLYIYYGGADTSLGVATLSKEKLMKKLLPNL